MKKYATVIKSINSENMTEQIKYYLEQKAKESFDDLSDSEKTTIMLFSEIEKSLEKYLDKLDRYIEYRAIIKESDFDDKKLYIKSNDRTIYNITIKRDKARLSTASINSKDILLNSEIFKNSDFELTDEKKRCAIVTDFDNLVTLIKTLDSVLYTESKK